MKLNSQLKQSDTRVGRGLFALVRLFQEEPVFPSLSELTIGVKTVILLSLAVLEVLTAKIGYVNSRLSCDRIQIVEVIILCFVPC